IKQGFCVNQRKYALELIAEVGLGNAKPSLTPLEYNIKLTNVSCFILQHKDGHSFFSTDHKSVYETTKNFGDSPIIGNPKSGILSIGVLQRLSVG
uniref:Reverse transcriptase Ty1/copia-type domain-containing protein n=1 Tax=Solanum lycopersicum TaxID=4081 RepID=A0A3Q7IHA6_SOLLC